MGLFKRKNLEEEYLEDLEKKLKEKNISNKKEILEKYKMRFKLGYEAGMIAEEIIAKLPDPFVEIRDTCKKIYHIEIKTALIQNIIFKRSEDSGLQYDLDCHNEDIIIEETSDKLLFKDRKARGILKKARYNLIVTLGDNIEIGNLDIKKVSGILELPEKFVINNGNIDLVSGKFKGNNFIFNELKISSVSCDLDFKGAFKGNNLKINSISGDITAEKMDVIEGKIRIISAKIKLKEYNNRLKLKTIMGEFSQF